MCILPLLNLPISYEHEIDGLMPRRRVSIAKTLELHVFCIKSSRSVFSLSREVLQDLVRSPWTHGVIITSLLRQNDVILT